MVKPGDKAVGRALAAFCTVTMNGVTAAGFVTVRLIGRVTGEFAAPLSVMMTLPAELSSPSFCGLTVTVNLPGVVPELGLTESHGVPPDDVLAVAVKANCPPPLMEVARLCTCGCAPPVWKLTGERACGFTIAMGPLGVVPPT